MRRRYAQRRHLLDQTGALGEDYPLTVAGSLSLSLESIGHESTAARDVLDCLCFLAPDGISKALVRQYLGRPICRLGSFRIKYELS
eukprot:COSAG05_NODE_188_length_14697_cov_11.861145_8_plen_86_part_00